MKVMITLNSSHWHAHCDPDTRTAYAHCVAHLPFTSSTVYRVLALLIAYRHFTDSSVSSLTSLYLPSSAPALLRPCRVLGREWGPPEFLEGYYTTISDGYTLHKSETLSRQHCLSVNGYTIHNSLTATRNLKYFSNAPRSNHQKTSRSKGAEDSGHRFRFRYTYLYQHSKSIIINHYYVLQFHGRVRLQWLMSWIRYQVSV